MKGGKLTVAASAVHFPDVDDLVVADRDPSTAIVLHNLVVCVLRTTNNDKHIALAQSSNGIFADIAEPDVADCALALAVNTLEGVGADDNILERRTFFKKENGVLGAGVTLSACHAPVEPAVAVVPGLAGLDGFDCLEDFDVANAGGDVKGLGGSEAGQEGDGEVLHFDSPLED